MAVAVVVHGPDVVALARHHVHQRVFALARHAEIVGRARRVRRAVHQEQDRQRLLAGLRRADALAPEIELHAALVGPVFRLQISASRRGGGVAPSAWADDRPDTRPAPMPTPALMRTVRRAMSLSCPSISLLPGCRTCRCACRLFAGMIADRGATAAGGRRTNAGVRRPSGLTAIVIAAMRSRRCVAGAGKSAGLAEPAGEGGGAVRRRRRRRPARPHRRGPPVEGLQAAVLHREPGRRRRRGGVEGRRARRCRRLHAADRRLGPAHHGAGGESQHRLRPGRRLHPHRDDRRRELRAVGAGEPRREDRSRS